MTRTDIHVRQWQGALVSVFAAAGFALASVLSRTPRIRDLLDASTTGMSLLLLALSGGAVVGMLSAGRLLRTVSPRRPVRYFGLAISVGLGVVGAGAALAATWVVALGLAVFGLGLGTLDIAMNLSGAALERRRRRPLLPFLHAMFSLGTFAGAALGAAAERLGVSVTGHVAGALVIFGAIAVIAPRFIADTVPPVDVPPASGPGPAAAWREPTTLLLGVVVLGMALAEGSANDWLSLVMVDGHDASKEIGALTLGIFLGAMTLARLAGGRLINRFGRLAVLRASAAVAIAGLLLVIVPDNAAVAMVGATIWGAGAALGFPIGLSAAAADPARAAARVSVVAALGYLSFLGGPPLIGFLAEHVGLRSSLYVVLVAIVASALAARPDPQTRDAVESDVSQGN